jgi:hypothetical protein
MSEDRTTEIYHVQKTYLEGWYTIEELKRIVETAERVKYVSDRLANEAALDFNTMDETIDIPDETWNKIYRKL